MYAQVLSDELGKSSLADRLSKRLSEELLKMPPGEKLPTGQEISRRYGVSLTVVREAISTLKADGLVETRQGLGAFVSRSRRQRPFRIDSTPDVTGAIGPEQIFELRSGVEMQASALAATRGSAAQHKAIKKAFKDMQAALTSGADGVAEDVLFHRRIAEAAGNILFSSFLDFLGEHIKDSISGSRQDDAAWRAQQVNVMKEHEDIVDAICARDADAARDAANRHMVNCLTRCAH